jgi:chromosome segregation ATPase
MRLTRCILTAVTLAALSGCGDDPEQVRKVREQRVEITRLSGELALLEEKLGNLPADKSGDLAVAKKQADDQAAEILKLEAEIVNLDAQRKALEDELASYKRKYPVR